MRTSILFEASYRDDERRFRTEVIQNPPTAMKRKAGLAPMSFWTLTHTLRHAPRWLFLLDGIGAIVTAAGVGLVLL